MKIQTSTGSVSYPPRLCLVFFLLLVLILLSYSNSFYCSWHLDDYANINWNSRLHVQELNPESLYNALFAYPPSGRGFYRPLASLTLALNWYFGQDRVVGYHIVNLFFHLLTALFLYLTVSILFRTPNIDEKNGEKVQFIALMTAALWALHPIQIQAVTYIVQRMAGMVTLFYLMSLYFYLRGRIVPGNMRRGLYFLLAIICFIAAVSSKQNAAILPLAVILIEIIFFQDLSRKKTRKILFYVLAGGCLMVMVAAGIFFRETIFSVFNGFADRKFTPWERLLTEARVIVFYLSQIAYPISTRLSINHDFIVSTSLIHPWTTLPSILIIISLVGICVRKIRRYPFLCFSILFFFLNHVIESTILPLDIVFEHRNYLPSLFLFVPVSGLIFHLISHYRQKNRAMGNLIVAFGILLIICFGTSTYIRNMAWRTEKSLWEDAMMKAPKSDRPVHNLAWGYYERIGEYGKALALYQKALTLDSNSVSAHASVYNNIAAIYFRMGNMPMAIDFWKRALAVYPRYEGAYYRISIVLSKMGNWRSAARYMDIVMPHATESVSLLNLRALIHFKMGEEKKALENLRRSLAIDPVKRDTLVNLGAVLASMSHYRRGLWFFNRANALYPDDQVTLLWRLAIHHQLGNTRLAGKEAEKLIDLVGHLKIRQFVLNVASDSEQISPPIEPVIPVILKALKARGESFSEIAERLSQNQLPQ